MTIPKRVLAGLQGLVLVAFLLWGCSSSTDPGDGGPLRVVYSPELQFLELETTQGAQFAASPSRPATFSARWLLNGAEVGTGETFAYEAGVVGYDTLTVLTELDGDSKERSWRITVLPRPSLIPPPVQNISVTHGEEPMDVIVGWQYIMTSHFPVTSYQLAGSYSGPIYMSNWDEAQQLGTFFPRPGFVGHRDTLTAVDDGMQPGSRIWIAVRGIDDRGQMSPMSEVRQHEISFPWYLDGTVVDVEGRPLPEIIIRFCEDQQGEACLTNSDAKGSFRIGPFPSIEAITLKTFSSNSQQTTPPFTAWFDFESAPIAYSDEGNELEVMLIPRYPSGIGLDFLSFFQYMTKTDITMPFRPNQNLYRWEEYPLKVFIPDYVRESDGLDFAANTRLVLGYWNEVMGEEYLVEVANQEDCDILMVFAELGSGTNGVATLVEPSDQEYILGEVIPELVTAAVNTAILPSAQRVQETAMHELGHAMGLLSHVPMASEDQYLMAITSAGALDGHYLDAVHEDEVRMLRAIRYLPQGTDMSRYRFDDLLP
jgi:hypothetical protein